MRKLIVTCECGQRMQVPRSAIGKTGMCPTCGKTMTIASANTTTAPVARPSGGEGFFGSRGSWWRGSGAGEPPEDAKRRFGEAVDLYYNGKYAEAVAIFNALAKQYPGNPDIENGRAQCLRGLRRPPSLALESKKPLLDGAKLDRKTVRQVVLEKMLTSASEAVQLQAAELGAKLLGMFDEPYIEDEDDGAVEMDDSTDRDVTDESPESTLEAGRDNGAHDASASEEVLESYSDISEQIVDK